MKQLAIQEVADLEQHEAVIERGLKTFVDVGNALMAIRDGRLYREQHATFEDYCHGRWGMNRGHANRLIRASGMMGSLDPMGSTFSPCLVYGGSKHERRAALDRAW